MLATIAQTITDALLKVFRFPELVTVLISVLPIVEARGAVPIAFRYDISPPFAFLYAFIGSSLMAPILIAVLLPFVRFLSKTRLFRKIGQTIYDKFEQKSKSIDGGESQEQADGIQNENTPKKRKRLSADARKMLGVYAFVAIPLPLTGVWTGSAVAALTKLPYPKALLSVVAGNLTATGIITLLCYFFADAIDYIILAIGIIAVLVVVTLIVKIILHKPKTETENNRENETENEQR